MHKAAILTLGISFGALAGCQTDTLPEIEVADTSLPKSATQGPPSKPIFENSEKAKQKCLINVAAN